ncbi:MAG: hypothetical protein ACXWQO_07720 [Bdellovibrionota bacterium]
MPESMPNPWEPHPENKAERNPARSLPQKKDAAKDFKKSNASRETKGKEIQKASTVTDGEDG